MQAREKSRSSTGATRVRSLPHSREGLLARRPDIDSIFIDYASVLADPAGETRRIADFLDGEFDLDAMVGGVDAALRNQGSDRGAAASE